MFVSVVVPTLNESSHIGEFLAMLARQTRPPDEVIFADSMSNDGTREIALSYGASILDVPVRGNIGLARHRAMQVVDPRATAILHADVDHRFGPRWLEIAARHLEDPSVVLVTGPVEARKHNPLTDAFAWMHNSSLRAGNWPGFGVWLWRRFPDITYKPFPVAEDTLLTWDLMARGEVVFDEDLAYLSRLPTTGVKEIVAVGVGLGIFGVGLAISHR